LRVDQPVQAFFSVDQLGSSPTLNIIDNPGSATTGQRAAFISNGFQGVPPLPQDVRQIVAINADSFVLGGNQEAWLGQAGDQVFTIQNTSPDTSLTIYLFDRNATSNVAGAAPGDLLPGSNVQTGYLQPILYPSASTFENGSIPASPMDMFPNDPGNGNVFLMELCDTSDDSPDFVVKVQFESPGMVGNIWTSGSVTLGIGESKSYYIHLKTYGGYYGPGADSNDEIQLDLEFLAVGT
jgi:hypothetical protein